MPPFMRSPLCYQFTDSKVPVCWSNLVSYTKYVANWPWSLSRCKMVLLSVQILHDPFLTHPFYTVQTQWPHMYAVLPTTVIFFLNCCVNGTLIHIALILTVLLSHKACEIIHVVAVSPQFLFHAELIPYGHTRVCSPVIYRWICGYCQC